MERNPKALWSLVGGILSITFCGFIVGIVAIIVGRQAQAEIAASGGLQGGEDLARWGIILGWISVVLGVLVGIMVIFTFAGGGRRTRRPEDRPPRGGCARVQAPKLAPMPVDHPAPFSPRWRGSWIWPTRPSIGLETATRPTPPTRSGCSAGS
jgi:hypothetical protein